LQKKVNDDKYFKTEEVSILLKYLFGRMGKKWVRKMNPFFGPARQAGGTKPDPTCQ
jgi:hypothetical protein